MPLIERDNYYILLGLEFDPPVTDAGQIRAALRAKKQEWTRWQDHPLKRNDGLAYLDEAANIESVMLDPVLREKEAVRAKEIKQDMLTQFEAELRVLECKGYILPKEASAIQVKYKDFGVTLELVYESLKCPISETFTPPPDDDGGEILDRVTAKTISRGLKVLGFLNLYTFLDEPQYSSIKKLQAASERVRRASALQGGKSPRAMISAELSGIAASIFDSVASKQKYDRYLKVAKYPALGELLDEEAVRSSWISPGVMLRIVNFAAIKYGVKILDAEEYIKAYCLAYNIPLDERGVNMACPNCGGKTPKNGKVCTICAQPFSGACPICGEAFDYAPRVCPSCGFQTGHMGKALKSIGDAENALIENNWSLAQKLLQYAGKYWPRHEKLTELEERAARIEESYNGYVDSINRLVGERRLYAAKERIDEASSRGLRMPPALLKSIAVEVAAFEKRVETLTEKGGLDVEALLKLSADVTDSAELSRILAAHPPEPPVQFMAEASGMSVAASWGESPSAFTDTYRLVRKNNSQSLTAFDGELLYEGSAHSFCDTTALPLTSYHYSLFSKRAGAYSRVAASSRAVMIVPEVKNLKILPMDTGARLSWDFDSGIYEVRIWRKQGKNAPSGPGDGELLPNERLDGFSDTKLINDAQYWYYIVPGYLADGAVVSSKGIAGAVIPRKLIAPVEDLNIAEAGAYGDYIVVWNAESHADILIFASATRPDFSEGDVFLAEDLLTRYRKLDLFYKNSGSAGFSFKFSGGMYFFAVFVFGRFATVSDPRYIVSVPEVQNQTCDLIGGSLFLSFKWPPLISDMLISYRFDRFPEAPYESGASVLDISRDQYDINAAAVINDPSPLVYYFTIFSAFSSPTGQIVYSKGARLMYNNLPSKEIFYSFAYKKKRFADSGALNVALSSSEEFVMPKAVITGRVGRLPLNRADGLVMFELKNDTIVKNSLSLQFTTSTLPEGIYLRLFFDDEAMYEKLRLIPAESLKLN